jgi:hypothetical protein
MRAEKRVGEQREKAKAAMDSAAAELAKAGPVRRANSDSVALAAYLQALGLDIDAGRVNKLLVLLAVLVIECGPGFSFAVGLSLSTPIERALDMAVSTGRRCPVVGPSQKERRCPCLWTAVHSGGARLVEELYQRGPPRTRACRGRQPLDWQDGYGSMIAGSSRSRPQRWGQEDRYRRWLLTSGAFRTLGELVGALDENVTF